MNTPTITFNAHGLTFAMRHATIIRGWIQRVVKKEGYNIVDISYVFCKDKFLLDLNKKYLNHNTLTDIITFDYATQKNIQGEIFISIDRIKENAKTFSSSQKDELHRVMIHGVLHLCGYKDKTPVQKTLMKSKENYYLSLRRF